MQLIVKVSTMYIVYYTYTTYMLNTNINILHCPLRPPTFYSTTTSHIISGHLWQIKPQLFSPQRGIKKQQLILNVFNRFVCKHKSTHLLLNPILKFTEASQQPTSLVKIVCLRSSGPVSYGYSELENNNQMSMTSSMATDLSLQTPNVEYSSTSIKKEILVRSEWLTRHVRTVPADICPDFSESW